MDPLIISGLFSGHSFKLDKYCASIPWFAQRIQENGGTIVSADFDFLIGCSTSEVLPGSRTPVWIERCIEENKLLDAGGFPFYVPTVGPHVCLDGLCVSITGFHGKTRLDMIAAIKWLGMQYEGRLTRLCRFVIAATTDCKKVPVALEWLIPVVSQQWLFAVAKGNPPDVFESFLVVALPFVETQLAKTASFLSDDEELPSDILAQIDTRVQHEATQPKPLSSDSQAKLALSGKTPPASYLSDSSDCEDLYEKVDAMIRGPAPASHPSLEDLSRTIKSHRTKQKPLAMIRRQPPPSDVLDTFTQRPVDPDSDRMPLKVEYLPDVHVVLQAGMPEDPLLQLLKEPDTAPVYCG
jgi:hypothetical protein